MASTIDISRLMNGKNRRHRLGLRTERIPRGGLLRFLRDGRGRTKASTGSRAAEAETRWLVLGASRREGGCDGT